MLMIARKSLLTGPDNLIPPLQISTRRGPIDRPTDSPFPKHDSNHPIHPLLVISLYADRYLSSAKARNLALSKRNAEKKKESKTPAHNCFRIVASLPFLSVFGLMQQIHYFPLLPTGFFHGWHVGWMIGMMMIFLS
ncbi:hypothetical protein B0T20DRAFT_172847 [Sordaria brevicollis]|uniref:Uncharacterized protein n=1 Tax=Sordaria brevicollis TaxID=83679 RepID=A0AAE0UDY6_SORBR|nr:hypothetical protein B0T20DRAFT_172847 [Sordaria brevicollis]